MGRDVGRPDKGRLAAPSVTSRPPDPTHLTRGRRSAICHAMADVSFPAAFGAGLLSFISPCVLPLAAPYLCFLAGASVEALADESETKARRDILITAVLFVAGFSTVFVGLGATASAFGTVLRQWSHALSIVAGIGVILMGLHFLGVFKIGAMLREKRVEIEKPAGLWSAYPMGFAFALGWTPCIGPILATILAVAGSRDTVASGAALLAVYSLGLGLPFIARRRRDRPVHPRVAPSARAVRPDREGCRRPAGRDRRRVSDWRLPERFALADRDVSAVRPDRVSVKKKPAGEGGFLIHSRCRRPLGEERPSKQTIRSRAARR